MLITHLSSKLGEVEFTLTSNRNRNSQHRLTESHLSPNLQPKQTTSNIKKMCTQDVIEYHCPCFGVAGEIHPCRAIQSRPPGNCVRIIRRTLHLPQKCAYCR